MNQELFKKIHDVISVAPERFHMKSWEESGDSCGLTRCVAGWAIYLTTGEPLRDRYGRMSDSVKALADELGEAEYYEYIGRNLLGLDKFEADLLFYSEPEIASEFVRLVAEGDEEAARALLDQLR